MPSSNDRRFNPENLSRLIETDRSARWQPFQRLESAGLKPGMNVLELGSGPGFWTHPIAEIIGPHGQVIALDVSAEMLSALSQQPLPENISAIQCELPIIPLSGKWAEFVWLAFVFHEVEPPASFARELFRVSQPGARIAVLEWQKNKQSDTGPPPAHRVSTAQVKSFLQSAGFTHIVTRWQDSEAYLIAAERGIH